MFEIVTPVRIFLVLWSPQLDLGYRSAVRIDSVRTLAHPSRARYELLDAHGAPSNFPSGATDLDIHARDGGNLHLGNHHSFIDEDLIWSIVRVGC